MVAKILKHYQHQENLKASLIAGLSDIPQDWAITPVNGNKAPYRSGWQSEPLLSRSVIEQEIKSNRAKGYGIRTGELSGGILAIDVDGVLAHQKMMELSGGDGLPETISFASGKPGRAQHLFYVSKDFWDTIQTTKIDCCKPPGEDKAQQLEFRWNGCQSVLPPSVHPETGKYFWLKSPQEIAIAEAPLWAIEAMLKDSPAAVAAPTVANTRHTTISSVPPLEIFLTREHRDFIQSGISEGSRNDSATALARDLLGTAARLNYLEIQFDGDPRQLLEDFARRCNPFLPAREIESVWKSAVKSNPTPCLSDDAITNCVKAWERSQQPTKASGRGISSNNLISINRTGGSGGNGGNGGGLGEVSLCNRILEILTRNGKESDRQIAFIELSKAVSRPLSEIKNLAEILETETSENDVTAARKSLEKLIKNQSANRLKISDYLWGDGGKLAQAIETVAREMPSAPEFLFTTLISTAASRIGTSSRIVIKASSKYIQNCIFWSAIVARSGQAKTPAQKVIINPLIALEVDANKQFKEDEKNYESKLADYKKTGNEDDEKPVKTTRKRYLTSDITAETLARVHGENPRGLLLYRDELAGMVKARNQYKKGAGADEENEISQFNGDAIIYDRADKSVCLERSAVSRTGSIQWDIARELLNQATDSNGGISRWLFCAVDAPRRYLNLLGEDTDTGIDEMLKKLYIGLGILGEKDYLVTKKAVKLFQDFQHTLIEKCFTDTRPGFGNVYPKIETYVARLALWLHLANAVLAGVTPEPAIDDHTMARAIELAKFFLGQAELIYGVNSDDGLTGDLLRLYRFCEGKGGITARQVKQSCYHFKKDKSVSTATIKSWFSQLAQMGHGSYSEDKFVVGVVGGVADLLLSSPTPKNHTPQGIQENVVDVVDVVDPIFSPSVDGLIKGVAATVVGLTNIANNQPETLINQGFFDKSTPNNKTTTTDEGQCVPHHEADLSPDPEKMTEEEMNGIADMLKDLHLMEDSAPTMLLALADLTAQEKAYVWGRLTAEQQRTVELLSTKLIQAGDRVRIRNGINPKSVYEVVEIFRITGNATLKSLSTPHRNITVFVDNLIRANLQTPEK